VTPVSGTMLCQSVEMLYCPQHSREVGVFSQEDWASTAVLIARIHSIYVETLFGKSIATAFRECRVRKKKKQKKTLERSCPRRIARHGT
jgi:hypothetical protein